MVYYCNGQNGIQVGLVYQVPSIQNGAPTESFIKDVKNIQKKLPKELKKMQIHYRVYIYTSSKTYFYGASSLIKTKNIITVMKITEIHIWKEKLLLQQF